MYHDFGGTQFHISITKIFSTQRIMARWVAGGGVVDLPPGATANRIGKS